MLHEKYLTAVLCSWRSPPTGLSRSPSSCLGKWQYLQHLDQMWSNSWNSSHHLERRLNLWIWNKELMGSRLESMRSRLALAFSTAFLICWGVLRPSKCYRCHEPTILRHCYSSKTECVKTPQSNLGWKTELPTPHTSQKPVQMPMAELARVFRVFSSLRP